MLLDLGRNDVGRVAKNKSVKVTEKMIIEYYSHVMHIVSNVEGAIDEKYDAVDALKLVFQQVPYLVLQKFVPWK